MAGSQGGVRAGRAFIEAYLDSTKVQAGLKQLRARFRSAGAAFRRVGAGLLGSAAAVATPIAFATKKYADFQDQVAATGAVTGASATQLAALASQAKELGRTTSNTASEIAALQTELGRAGFSPDEIIAATPAIRNLVRATGTDLAQSAQIAAAAMRQFGLEASDTTRISDVLTATANSSAQTLEDIGESMKYVGPIASDAGMSLEQTAKAAGFLANMGIKGSMAGTGLKTVLTRLADPKIAKKMEAMGVAIDVSDPIKTLGELGKAMAGMSNADRLATLNELFGLRGMVGASKMAGDAKSYERVSDAIDEAGGAAARTSQMMDDTLGGTFRRILSAAEGVQIAIGESLTPMFRSLESAITGPLEMFSKFVEANGELMQSIAVGIAIVGGIGAALIATGLAANFAGFIIGGLASVIGVLGSIAGVLPALAIVGGIAAGVGSLVYYFVDLQKAGSGVMSVLGPIGETIGNMLSPFEQLGSYLGGEFSSLWEEWSDIASTSVTGVMAAIKEGDWESAGNIAMEGLKAAWATGIASLTTMWEDFKLYLIEAFAGAVVSVQKMWTDMQSNIAKGLLDKAGQDGPLGAAARFIIGVDMRKENERGKRLDAALGLSGPSATDAAKAIVDEETKAQQDAFAESGFGRRMLDMAETARQQRDEAVARAEKGAADSKAQLDESVSEVANPFDDSNAVSPLQMMANDVQDWFSGWMQNAQQVAAAAAEGTNDSAENLALASVGGFSIHGVQSSLGPSLLNETKKQSDLLGQIVDNTDGEDSYT